MTIGKTGTCEHGEFLLTAGCPQCIAKKREGTMPADDVLPTNDSEMPGPLLVKVQYYSESGQQLSGRAYTYFSEDPLSVGDIVIVPVRDTTGKARVSAICVPDAEIAAFRDKVKTIPSGSIVVAPEPPATASQIAPALAEAPAASIADEEIMAGLRPASQDIQEETAVESSTQQEKPSAEALRIARMNQEPGLDDWIPGGHALIQIGPEADAKVQALYANAVHLLEWAEARVITENADLKSATEDLSVIARLKKALNEKKDEFVKPVRAFLNGFNDTFKTMLAPIEEADRITRDKMTAFGEDQRRKREEAAQLDADKLDVANREAALNQGEITQDITPTPAPPPVPERVRTDIGTAGQRDNWKYEVIDFALLPDEYKMVDTALLNATAKRHHDQKHIVGVRFYNEPIITVRTQ